MEEIDQPKLERIGRIALICFLVIFITTASIASYYLKQQRAAYYKNGLQGIVISKEKSVKGSYHIELILTDREHYSFSASQEAFETINIKDTITILPNSKNCRINNSEKTYYGCSQGY